MPGIKTSVWLGEDLHTQWKASGDSLTEIVKRGLADHGSGTPVTADQVREIIREELSAADDRVARIVRTELARATGRPD